MPKTTKTNQPNQTTTMPWLFKKLYLAVLLTRKRLKSDLPTLA